MGFVEVTTDASGNATFAATVLGLVPAGGSVTGTATDPDNNTSEFSVCAEVQDGQDSEPGSIHGFKFEDMNVDGVYEPGGGDVPWAGFRLS